MPDKQYYVDRALQLGADHAVLFTLDEIVFDSRTILKCMFGCADWGKGHTCPSRPGSLKPWEYRKIFAEYSWGVIIHSTNKKTAQEVSFAIEREASSTATISPFPSATAPSAPSAPVLKGSPVSTRRKPVPPFTVWGLMSSRTVRQFGLPIQTLKDENQEQNWYAAVFIA